MRAAEGIGSHGGKEPVFTSVEYHAKVNLPRDVRDERGNFGLGEGKLGPVIARFDRALLRRPIGDPTIQIKFSPSLLETIDHEWVIVEINGLNPLSAIPKVFERPVPLPLEIVTLEYEIKLRLDVWRERTWTPEMHGDVEIVIAGKAIP